MTKNKSTKRSLLMSVLSLLVCISMLIGSTFAWFTDSVTSGRNVIAAGNLDIELLVDGATKVDAATALFDDVALWEPGVVVYENLQVANVGTLALKYQMVLNVIGENTLDGHGLSEVVKVAVIDAVAAGTSRAEVLAAAKASGNVCDLADFCVEGELLAKTNADAQAIVIFWEPNSADIDNLYNVNNGKSTSDGQPLYIEFGVNLQAVQLDYESDSFGKDYDEGLSPTTAYISSLDDLQAIVADLNASYNKESGYTKSANIVLMDDLIVDESAEFMYTEKLNGCLVYLYHANVTIDLNGHDIIVADDALMSGKDEATALFLVRYSELNIVGEGTISTSNKAIAVYGWAHSQINIYGGTFDCNAYERNESAIYVNNNNVTINVYGGDYLSTKYAFNAHDNCGTTPVIVLHEGVVYERFLKNGTTDVTAADLNKGRIVLAEDCVLETFEENGQTFHRVVKA